MALQVWLPLNGNLNNQGLTNITVTNNGATVDNNGKIGKCYSFNSNKYLSVPNPITTSTTAFSISTWVYVTQFNSGFACICSGRSATSGAGVAFWVTPSYIRLDDGAMYQVNATISTGTWVHVCATWSSSKKSIYLNGQELGSSTSISKLANLSANMQIGSDAFTTTTYCLNGKLNDFRVYDRALAPKEIEILSRGLVCHYPLCDISNQTSNNVAYNPTFNTNLASGGWNHWGISGSSGSYGQTTDKNYIFRKDQTYAHWFSNASTAIGYYLVYQSPSFEGGFRSLYAILKEENSNPITQSIVYPSWNANVSSGTPFEKWTSITSLGDGFYLCKCEGIKQDGSNNLIGLKVNVGYKVYISELYIENDRTVCSDFFYPSTTVYDTSGFKNNGETYAYDTTGSIECSSDTARYSLSTFINSANVTNNATGIRYIYGNCELTTPQYLTVAFWCKPIAGYGGIANNGIFALTNNDIGAGAATDYNTAPMHNRDADIDMCTSTNVHKTMAFTTTTNEWHHYAVVYDGRYGKVYKDGVHTATLDMGSNLSLASFKAIVIGYSHAGGVYRKVRAYYSDFRIYATALSATQVAELYNTAVSVSNNGALLGYELVEV